MKKLDWYLYGSKYVLNKKIWKRRPKYKNVFLESMDANNKLREAILNGKPYMAARIGFNEMSMMKAFDFNRKDKMDIVLKNMCDVAGFFPNDRNLGNKFLEVMIHSLKETDLLALMNTPFEDYYANKYLQKEAMVTPFEVMDFWKYQDSWTKALKGKKVLVIHPFTESIEQQYRKRKDIFAENQFLPDMELITYKAVQTAGGEVDSRFTTWFDALEYMQKDIDKIDFDIAIIGCGAYGFPLAAHIKGLGKQAVHMGGVSQILFGIKGQRWTKKGSSCAHLINESWVWPMVSETPVDTERMENGPYFRPTESYERRIKESNK